MRGKSCLNLQCEWCGRDWIRDTAFKRWKFIECWDYRTDGVQGRAAAVKRGLYLPFLTECLNRDTRASTGTGTCPAQGTSQGPPVVTPQAQLQNPGDTDGLRLYKGLPWGLQALGNSLAGLQGCCWHWGALPVAVTPEQCRWQHPGAVLLAALLRGLQPGSGVCARQRSSGSNLISSENRGHSSSSWKLRNNEGLQHN